MLATLATLAALLPPNPLLPPCRIPPLNSIDWFDEAIGGNFAHLSTGPAPRGSVVYHFRQLPTDVVVSVTEFGVVLGGQVATTQSEIQVNLGFCCLAVAIA
jgi:hypothetical protein